MAVKTKQKKLITSEKNSRENDNGVGDKREKKPWITSVVLRVCM